MSEKGISYILEQYGEYWGERGKDFASDYKIGDFGRFRSYLTIVHDDKTVMPFIYDSETRKIINLGELVKVNTLDSLNKLLDKLSLHFQSLYPEMEIDLKIGD